MKMKLLFKSITFIKRYIFVDPFFVLLYAYAYIQKKYSAGALVMSEEKTIRAIMERKSFIRLGDGEMALLKLFDIHFQKADKKIRTTFLELIIGYTENSPFVLAVPTRYINKSNEELKKLSLFSCWLPFKVAFRQYFPKEIEYADAHAFYVSGFFEKNFTEYLKTKNVLVISKKSDIEAFKKNAGHICQNITYIEGPSEQAFSKYLSIKKSIDMYLEKKDMQSVVVLAGVGPTSKILAYEYSKIGLQVLDMGHGFAYLYTEKALDHVLV